MKPSSSLRIIGIEIKIRSEIRIKIRIDITVRITIAIQGPVVGSRFSLNSG